MCPIFRPLVPPLLQLLNTNLRLRETCSLSKSKALGLIVLHIGGAVAQSVESATPGEEVLGPGFDSRCGRPLPTGWVGVSIM